MDATDEQLECISRLIGTYAQMKHVTNTQVAHALVSSKTLAKHHYTHAQKGHLTADQAQADIGVLHFWIDAATEQRSAETTARHRRARQDQNGVI